ncbi:uncharacterized protein LOC114798052 [Denticeps clupeoides]|uniref:uncharacterized protein LOC114798052 n=1 Tax=Denticeps clupeoides TaxID=299321 RepID=UPI0010A2FAAC|nr:uncharacterized protein LOC114798052 [Denticeps clupeoides]
MLGTGSTLLLPSPGVRSRQLLGAMSEGGSVQAMPRAQSGIPLPRSKLPSPKPSPKRVSSGLPRPTQIPAGRSTNTCPSRDLLRDSCIRTPKQVQRGGLPVPHVSFRAHFQSQGSRSAFSSPQVRRKESPRSKDTLDVGKASSLEVPRSNINKNFLSGNLRPQLKKMDSKFNLNSRNNRFDDNALGTHQSSVALSFRKFSNGNLQPPTTYSGNTENNRGEVFKNRLLVKQSASCSCSDEEMYTPEDLSPILPLPESQACLDIEEALSVDLLKEKQLRVNMAAIAPFRYRLQIGEDVCLMDDFSDCSPGSVEVCCEDFSVGE